MNVTERAGGRMSEEAIEQTNREFERRVVAQDAAGLSELYTEDARLLPPDLPALEGRAAIQAGLQGLFDAGYRELLLTTVKMEILDDLAVRQGRYQAKAELPDGGGFSEAGKTMELYRRQPDGRWLLEADIFNRDAPLPMT